MSVIMIFNPHKSNISFSKNNRRGEPLPSMVKPIESPQIIKLINTDKCLFYTDPFFNNIPFDIFNKHALKTK